jgi:hypothetical protein
MLTARAFFNDAQEVPLASLEQIVGSRGIVVVAPYRMRSHPNSRSRRPDRLRDMRENEAPSATQLLVRTPRQSPSCVCPTVSSRRWRRGGKDSPGNRACG